jgi:transposase
VTRALAQQMPFAAVARIAGESANRVLEVCKRYVELALAQADFSDIKALAIDETSRARGPRLHHLGGRQAAKRRARGFTRLSAIKTIIFLIAGKLDFHAVNPHAR